MSLPLCPSGAGHPSRLHRLSCLRHPSCPRHLSYPHRPSHPHSESLQLWLLCLLPATTDMVLVLAPSWILEALAADSSAI
ncbi:hypothetical protein BJV77DRAFT_1011776, partial [Russula vinacea]